MLEEGNNLEKAPQITWVNIKYAFPFYFSVLDCNSRKAEWQDKRKYTY